MTSCLDIVFTRVTCLVVLGVLSCAGIAQGQEQSGFASGGPVGQSAAGPAVSWSGPIDRIDAAIRLDGGVMPHDSAAEATAARNMQPAPHVWDRTCFHWAPSLLAYRPTYFDDVPLERYGQTLCPSVEPVLSGARFAGNLALLPYKMGLEHPHDCYSILGYYEPGSCAPCVRERCRFEWDAAAIGLGAWVGGIFVLP
jgi:hypothetical protein